MKKLGLILFLCAWLVHSSAYSQEYLNIGKKTLVESFEKSDSMRVIDGVNSIIATSLYANDKFIARYHFGENGLCDSSSIQYYCGRCARNFVDVLLESKKDKWVQTSPGTYISHERLSFVMSTDRKERTSECKQMTIIETPEKEICTTILFKIVTMKTAEWKNLMHKR